VITALQAGTNRRIRSLTDQVGFAQTRPARIVQPMPKQATHSSRSPITSRRGLSIEYQQPKRDSSQRDALSLRRAFRRNGRFFRQFDIPQQTAADAPGLGLIVTSNGLHPHEQPRRHELYRETIADKVT